MSRAFTALFLVVSLVSGVFFFVPSNSAEYDEDFYEYQPFLQYDFNLHGLDLKNYDEEEVNVTVLHDHSLLEWASWC